MNGKEERGVAVVWENAARLPAPGDMDDVLLVQMAKLTRREKCAHCMPAVWFPVSDKVLIGLADNLTSVRVASLN